MRLPATAARAYRGVPLVYFECMTGARAVIHPQATVPRTRRHPPRAAASEHRDGLADAAADGELWELWFTSVPDPPRRSRYIRRRAERAGGRPHAAVGRPRPRRPTPSSAARATTTSCRRSIASRSATRGTRRAASAPTSTPRASCCCSSTRSTRSAAPSSACAPTTSTSARSRRSRRWREEGRRAPASSGAARRQRARFGDVQHSRGGVARREAAPGVATETAPMTLYVRC